MKKQITAFLLLLTMLVGILPAFAAEEDTSPAEETKISFADVGEEHFAYKAVMHLAEQGVIAGKSKDLFCPDDSLKREELAKIIVAAFSLSDTSGYKPLNDVLSGTWYGGYVQRILVAGLMEGVSDTEFGVGQTLTRQDLAVILKRYLDSKKVEYNAQTSAVYADNGDISDYAKEAVSTLASEGIMQPRTDGMWYPKMPATRAETALAVYNVINFLKEYEGSLGRYGSIRQYDPPYEVIEGDRIADAMPPYFDATKWPQEEICYEDLEDTDYGVLQKSYWSSNAVQLTEGGYDGKGCIKIDGEGYAKLMYVAEPGEFNPGDYLSLSGMVKGENITGGSSSKWYCNVLAVHDENNVWLNEAHDKRGTADREWTKVDQILMVPEPLNALTRPKYYIINIHLHVGGIESGQVYFDDLRLSKIKFDSMDTVLMNPAYKGIVKGEGGKGDILARAYVNELNGIYDRTTMKLTAQITDENRKVYLKSEAPDVAYSNDIFFSSDTLPMDGDYWLEIILSDKETGEEIQREEWAIHKRKADFETTIGYDEYGRITRNGEAYFPISTYNWSTHAGLDKDVIGNSAYDNLQWSAMQWYYNYGENKEYRDVIEGLDANNQTVSFSTGNMGFSYMNAGVVLERVSKQTDIRGLLTKLVTNFKDLPNLFAWYIYDERNGVREGPEHAWVKKIIESMDLNHPTTCAIDNNIPYRKGVYSITSDFLGFDPYPVTGKANQDISEVYRRLSEAKELNPGRPVYAIMQGFWFNTRKDLRGPTQQEFRNMVFQALCAEVCMLDCYGYRQNMEYPSPGRTPEEEWNTYTDVFHEVQYLEPIYISTLPAPYYEVKGAGEWLKTISKRYDGKSYLFTVNTDPTENVAMIHLDGVKKIKGMYSKKEYEADENGWFEIEWDSYGTEVFEYDQEDYKSSHAELKHFAVADTVMTNSEEAVSELVIPEGKNDIDYHAYISDYAKLYINDKEAECVGNLDITNLTEIKVKVVSEDGRFQTEKTYLLKGSEI